MVGDETRARGSAGAKPLPCCPTLRRIPTAMSPTQRDEPPYEMKGSVIPVMGMRLATTAMFTHAWKTSQVVTPVAMSPPTASGACSAMRTPR